MSLDLCQEADEDGMVRPRLRVGNKDPKKGEECPLRRIGNTN